MEIDVGMRFVNRPNIYPLKYEGQNPLEISLVLFVEIRKNWTVEAYTAVNQDRMREHAKLVA